MCLKQDCANFEKKFPKFIFFTVERKKKRFGDEKEMRKKIEFMQILLLKKSCCVFDLSTKEKMERVFECYAHIDCDSDEQK